MPLKRILIAVVFIMACLPAFAQHPFTQKLNDLATITFPDTPKLNKTAKNLYYSVEVNGVVYMASVGSWSSGPFDDFSHDLPDTAYAALIREVKGFSDGRVFFEKKIKINDLKADEYGYSSLSDSMTYYRYHRALYLKNKMIIFGFNAYDSLKIDQRALKDFYATFKVTLPNAADGQRTIADALFNFKAVLWAAIALVAGVGIIFIIKKFAQS